MTNFTVYGERCSGTTYLQKILADNFDMKLTWNYGWKHFFGFNELKNADNTIFFAIIRNPYDWLSSLHRDKHHIAQHLRGSFHDFLTKEWWSYYDLPLHGENYGKEILHDRNIYSPDRYKNVFEMRKGKNRFLTKDLPGMVKNYYLIIYDKFIEDPVKYLKDIKDKFKLELKQNKYITIDYKVRADPNKSNKAVKFTKSKHDIDAKTLELINKNLDWSVESNLSFKKRNS